jgi:hypothetical protein
MVNSTTLIGTREHQKLWTRCRINRCRYNRDRRYMLYTECFRRYLPHIGRTFLRLNYIDIYQQTYLYFKLNGYGDNDAVSFTE